MEAVVAENSGQSLVESAIAYARRGWPVFPLKEGGKLPLTVRGFKDASTDEATIRAWWQRWPKANIGVPTGERSGLAVVDIDPRHGGHVTFEQVTESHGAPPETLECETGGGGRHLYFNHVAGFKNSAGAIGAGIDTRGEGGYVVVPPSVHESGREYLWADGEDHRAIADVPDWLNPSVKNSFPRLAAGNLAGFTAGPAKADGSPVAPGGRNNAAASLAGQFIRQGDSLAEVTRKVRDWNRANPAPMGNGEVEKTIASVVKTHLRNNPGDEIRVTDGPATAANDRPARVTAAFPEELLSPPGLVGEICRWMNDTAIKPQPVLALANSLAFLGAVIGRKVRTPSDLRSNLYVLGVGESGCGKDHSRKCIKRICEAAGLTADLLGGEEVSSDSAILAAVHAHPSILFQFDEIGHFLANANSRYAAVHQKNIAPTFTKLFSSANTTFIGKEYAGGRAREDIIQPNVCLYGTTVPSRLYDGLTPAEISDGFLGRMIVFQGAEADPPERETIAATTPPDSIVLQVQTWYQRQDLPRAEGNIASLVHSPIEVRMEDEANAIIRKFRLECRRRKAELRGNNGLDVVWSRAAEHAIKVALVVACGCEFQAPIISGQVAAWSVALVDHLVAALVETIRNSIAGSDYERDLLYVQRIIEDSGEAGLTMSNLILRTRRLKKMQRVEILNHLIEAGDVEKSEQRGTAGRPSTTFRRTFYT